MGITLAELARRLEARVRGDLELVLERVAPLEKAGPHDIAFLRDARHRKLLAGTRAGAVILMPTDADMYGGSALIVNNPHASFARVAEWLHRPPGVVGGIHPTAVIAESADVDDSAWIGPYVVVEPDAVIGPGASVGAGCYIGNAVLIGARCRLYSQVVVHERCVVGKECIVHSGAVIGADGFGFAKDGVEWIKVPQLGRVVIGDRVEIGANTAIDRGALDDTVIGDGVKLDNLIQIGHNVTVGEHTAMAAGVAVAGSAEIGKRCTIGGCAGIRGHIVIADDVHITASSMVLSSVSQPGVYSSALKAEAAVKWRKNAARLYRLDEMARRMRELEQKIEKLAEEQSH
jgi:UDP-3-O-[3-hydroxymyristoyl] glucosamine N-acyltransferase